MPSPVIFISAVSRELQSTRFIVANTLTALGYKPTWQEITSTETGDVKALIGDGVDQSHAVLQIVGRSYGFAPTEPDEEFGPVSYTQYEALYAHSKKKPVWYIILDESHPTDCENDEPEELQKLQSDYRTHIQAQHALCHSSDTPRSTESIVRKLCEDISKHRRRSRQRALVIVLVLLTIAGIVWSAQRPGKTAESLSPAPTQEIATTGRPEAEAFLDEPAPEKPAEEAAIIPSPLSDMEKILFGLADAENRSSLPGEKLTMGELRTRAFTLLETEFKLAPGTLATSLPAFALEVYEKPDSDLIMKASAAYALNQFEEAEKLFLEEESKDSAAMKKPGKEANELRTKRIQSLEGAAQFATAQIQYARAVEHYRAAAALTSVERDPLEWARIQHMLAYALTYNGQYSDVADTLSQVIPVYEKNLGAEHTATLSSSNNLANALNSLGKHAEAEERHRAVLAIRERVLGLDHPDTLISRNNLAAAQNYQRKHSEAEEQQRAVLEVRERILGADHPDTLFSRNNLAKTLSNQGKHAEAEVQHRAVLAIRGRILGAEHPDTLASRNDLAKSLRSLRKFAESEEQYRTVLTIRERVLGTEHHDVYLSCHSLALSLASQGKKEEALVFAKRGLDGFTKSLGADNPYSKAAAKLVGLLETR
jgi:Tetratricopeptide repeat/Domain of unknown function (DUF4062)